MNEYVVTHKDKRNLIKISANSEITINGKSHHYELIVLNNSTFRLRIDQKIYDISPSKIDNNRFSISLEGYTFETVAMTTLQERASKVIEQTGSAHKLKEIKAPMPGMILKIKKKVGEQIEAGESIIILEAMKMENDIKSPSSGVIKNIYITESSAVEKGAKLFSIE
jgi:biotin carboxyl carrier protein